MTPRKCRPKTMMTAPATRPNRIWFCKKELPEDRRGEAEEDEHRRQPQHEEQRREQRLSPRRAGIVVHLVQRDAPHIGEVGRHDRQDAGAEKTQRTGGQRHQHRRQKRRVEKIDPEHGPRGRWLFSPTSRGGSVTFPWTRGRRATHGPAPWHCDIEIDAIGLKCPLPVLRLQKRLARPRPGPGRAASGERPHGPDRRAAFLRRGGPSTSSTTETRQTGISRFVIRKARLIPFIFPKIRKTAAGGRCKGARCPRAPRPLSRRASAHAGPRRASWSRPGRAPDAPACCAPRPRRCRARPPARCRNRSCRRNR
jgi:type IV secretory pathway VirB10-like protein